MLTPRRPSHAHTPSPAPTAQYLSYVLGWPVINADLKENSSKYAAPRDAEALRQLTLSARAD